MNAGAASKEGVFVPNLKAGDSFERGDSLGWLYSLRGELLQTFFARRPGRILSYPERAWLLSNQCCATVIVPENG